MGLIGTLIPLQLLLGCNVQSQTFNKKSKLVYNPPKDASAPIVTKGAVVRGTCSYNSCLMALMPGTKYSLDHFPATVSTHPTFFFNTQFNTAKTSIRARFVLYKAQGAQSADTDIIYKTSFMINGDSGIIKFTLPPNAPDLEVNRLYQWKLFTNVDSVEILKGFIQRVETSAELQEQINQAPASELAVIYAKAGIWFETVKALADQKLANPNNSEILSQWSDLLSDVQLGGVVTQPIVDCCTAAK